MSQILKIKLTELKILSGIIFFNFSGALCFRKVFFLQGFFVF
jgi:hypothetical protein